MTLYNGLNFNGLVTFGNRSDVCELSARDLAHQEKISYAEARRKIRGQLEGKRVVKFRYNGSDVVISLDFIHKIAEEFPVENKQAKTVQDVNVDEINQDVKVDETETAE